MEWKNKSILIVEDDPDSTSYLLQILERTSASITHVTHGEEAVKICREGQPCDLILMDIRLPDLDGLETSRQIRNLRPNIPQIAQTAFVFPDNPNYYLKQGFDSFIYKPYRVKDLLTLLEPFIADC